MVALLNRGALAESLSPVGDQFPEPGLVRSGKIMKLVGGTCSGLAGIIVGILLRTVRLMEERSGNTDATGTAASAPPSCGSVVAAVSVKIGKTEHAATGPSNRWGYLRSWHSRANRGREFIRRQGWRKEGRQVRKANAGVGKRSACVTAAAIRMSATCAGADRTVPRAPSPPTVSPTLVAAENLQYGHQYGRTRV